MKVITIYGGIALISFIGMIITVPEKYKSQTLKGDEVKNIEKPINKEKNLRMMRRHRKLTKKKLI